MKCNLMKTNVSAIMCAKDAEKHIVNCSLLLDQTSKHLEIVIIDDGCYESTAYMIKNIQ